MISISSLSSALFAGVKVQLTAGEGYPLVSQTTKKEDPSL